MRMTFTQRRIQHQIPGLILHFSPDTWMFYRENKQRSATSRRECRLISEAKHLFSNVFGVGTVSCNILIDHHHKPYRKMTHAVRIGKSVAIPTPIMVVVYRFQQFHWYC